MSIYIASAGKVFLERWSIRESDKGEMHFVGYDICKRDGRVSTPIKTFDAVTRTGTTASGSKYRLVGQAGHDSDAEYVWGIATRSWEIETWKDTTANVVPDWRIGLPLTDEELHGDSDPGDGSSC